MKTHSVVIACALLAACDKPDTRDGAPPPTTNEHGYLEKVTKLPEGQLRGVLYRAIIDGGAECPQVTAAARETDQNGRAVWSAACASGSRWLVSIGDDGIAQARPADKAR